MSRVPAAWSAAAVVHPSVRFSCRKRVIPRSPWTAAKSIASVVSVDPLDQLEAPSEYHSISDVIVGGESNALWRTVLDQPVYQMNGLKVECWARQALPPRPPRIAGRHLTHPLVHVEMPERHRVKCRTPKYNVGCIPKKTSGSSYSVSSTRRLYAATASCGSSPQSSGRVAAGSLSDVSERAVTLERALTRRSGDRAKESNDGSLRVKSTLGGLDISSAQDSRTANSTLHNVVFNVAYIT